MSKFKDYFSRVDRLTSMYLSTGELPVVALAGPYNTGKSTMVNSLLGQQVSPVDVLPATSVPVIFSRDELFSITARLADGRIKVLSSTEFESLPKVKEALARRVLEVEVSLNHELLRRMRLVDTPGFDAATGTDGLPDQLAKADHIVYMLHQRGPGEADRKFIGQLLESAGVEKLSFWINRNLGHYDGTSLTESRRVLREICAREIQVHVTDTMNPEAVRRFRLFIQDRAADVVIKSVTRQLKELDRQIPGLTSASLQENNDTSFLLHFWDASQAASKVIQGRNIIKTLPLVSKQIGASVDELIRPAKGLPHMSVVSLTRGTAPDPALVKGRIKSVLTRAADDPVLQSAHETMALMRALTRELDREQYLVTAAGGFSTGKTTFFNALLGEALLPAENRPTTFTVTRLRYGDRKKAMVRFANQVTIPTHYVEKKQAIICRHELEVLERWLTSPKLRSGISALEKVKKGRNARISPDELCLEIETLKETFARVRHRSKKGRRPWKSLFKRIPLSSFNGSERADYYVVHFPHQESIELDLTNETDIKTLEQTAGSYHALRVEEIVISHPADILRTADFLDTPGLDSVYHRHREITTRYLPDSDCFLFFLNSKHILTRPDLSTYNIISGALSRVGNSTGKLFVIVNFADTLNEREKERVRNYLHANLVRPSRGTRNPVKIYLVSALDALTGKDGHALSHLTGDLKERIWLSRCADNYAGIIRRAGTALAGLLEEKTSSIPSYTEQNEQFRQDQEQVLQTTAKVLADWQNKIESLDSPADFLGFRDGKKLVRKGFLGLARKAVPYPSYRDLATEINTTLKSFQSKWYPGADITISKLNAEVLKDILDRMLEDKTLNPGEARSNLLTLLDEETLNIRETLQQLAQKHEKEAQAAIKKGATNPSKSLIAAVTQYTRELENLESEITTPTGGNANGKCQGAG
ncbi:MAG TPA: hypothetical protein DEF34_02695 [Desulfotomaculum sp.]|nr:MAG: hypothetical protein JL56_15415 [Desulfotomaculum sp. BICA1-6]HBX22536.1 hypothetical protein [Desulfotomaculum sp.]